MIPTNLHRHASARRLGTGAMVGAALFAAALWIVAFSAPLHAEPYFTVREGLKCSQCHVNKTGGGKRTEFGTVYLNTRGSMWPGLPDWGAEDSSDDDGDSDAATSDFAHGRLTDYFSVGADLRSSYHTRYQSDGDVERFDRESVCMSCHSSTDGGGKRGEFYFQMDLVPDRAYIYAGENLLPRNDTREMAVVVQSLPLNGYVKAGTFRLHSAFNRYYDDPFAHGVNNGNTHYLPGRGVGVEFGIEPGPFSVTYAITNAGLPEEPVNTTAKRQTAVGYAVFKHGTIGVSWGSDPTTGTKERQISGMFGGVHAGRFTGLLELDRIKDEEQETEPELGTAELNILITRGNNFKMLYEYLDPDRNEKGDIQDRTSFIYEPILLPNLQVRVGYRKGVGPEDETVSNNEKYFLELHALF